MAGLKLSMVMLMMMMVLASMQLQGTVAQTRHVVGDALGWTIPPGGAAAYTTWASRQNFTVGDILFFNFTTGQHNVAQVSQAAYGPCTTTNPISFTTNGPAAITLTAAGAHYYICTVGTHCQIGQKLMINVSAAAAAPTTPPPAAPTPAPVSPPTTTPAPAPSTTTPPPRSSPAPSPTEASPPSPPTAAAPSPTGSTTPPPSGSTTPSPSGSTTPSPSGSTTPSPAGSTTPPPPAGNSASSFTTVAPVTFLAMALAFFY